MTAAQVHALSEGEYFVRALGTPLFAALHVEPYCVRCAASGLDPVLVCASADRHVEFQCGHVAGRIHKGRDPILQKLLWEIGWNLRCTDCHEDLQGDNSQGQATFTVRCACTIRECPNPLSYLVATPSTRIH